MELIRSGTKIPFTRYRKLAIILSTLVNLIVLAFLFFKGPTMGVDFAGGTIVQLKFQQKTTIPDIRQALEAIQLGGSTIQDFGQEGANEFLVRVEKAGVEVAALGDQIKKALASKFGADKVRDPPGRVSSARRSVRICAGAARWSVIASTVMMGVYIWIRFASAFGAKFGLHFGLGAVIALIHDVLVTVGALMLANYEFDLTVVAALLTIVGFSVNDTVVICDRIRENLRKIRRESLESIINTSIKRDFEPDDSDHRHGIVGFVGALSARRRGDPAVRLCLVGGLCLRRLLDDFYRQSGHPAVGEDAC